MQAATKVEPTAQDVYTTLRDAMRPIAAHVDALSNAGRDSASRDGHVQDAYRAAVAALKIAAGLGRSTDLANETQYRLAAIVALAALYLDDLGAPDILDGEWRQQVPRAQPPEWRVPRYELVSALLALEPGLSHEFKSPTAPASWQEEENGD